MIGTTKDAGVLCARNEQAEAKSARSRSAARTASYSPSPSDCELLAAMMASNSHGHVLSERLLARFGSVAAIARAHPADLTMVEGIGQATATRLVAAFQLARRAIAEQPPVRITGTEDIVAVAAPLLHGHSRERLVVVICNKVNRVIGYETISDGSADRALLPVREVIVAVLRRDGLSFALAHNHPSGDPTPSRNDFTATMAVDRAAQATGLRLIEHVVVTDTDWRAVPDSVSGYWTSVPQVGTC